MKMIRFLGDGRNLQHRRRVPATIRMSLRLLLLVCAMLASVPQGNAFTCFASADLDFETRAMATDHRNLFLPRTDGVGANEQSKRQVEVTQSEAPVATIRAASPDLGSSFEDRFSAVLEGTIPGEGANIQQLMELFRSRVRGL